MARPLTRPLTLSQSVGVVGALVFVAPLTFLLLAMLAETILAKRTELRIEECAIAYGTRAELQQCARHHFRVLTATARAPNAPREVLSGLETRGLDDRFADFFYADWRTEDGRAALESRIDARIAQRNGPHFQCEFVWGYNLRLCSYLWQNSNKSVWVFGTSRTAQEVRYVGRRQLSGMGLLGAGIALMLVLALRRRVTAPLAALAKSIAARETRSDAHISEDGPAEIEAVARAFNRLHDVLAERAQEHEAALADLAHEMKNPVAAIRAATELLDGSDKEQVARLAHNIRQSNLRLERLIFDFLQLARAEAGFARESMESVDVVALVHSVVATSAHPTHIALAVDVPGQPFFCLGVSLRLESALRNLVDNALAFAQSRVSVACAIVERDGHHTISITVTDDGPGLPADMYERVFERFVTTREHRAGDSKRGTGLGLTIARAIARAHGGDVHVSSGANGAVFVLHLPMAPHTLVAQTT